MDSPSRTPSRLRVALVLNALPIGGLERFALDLGRGLIASGDAVTYFLVKGEGEWAREASGEVRVLGPAGLPLGPGADLRALAGLPALVSALREFRPDVVQTHLATSQILGHLAVWGLGEFGARTPLLHVEQNLYPWKTATVTALERGMIRRPASSPRTLWVTPTRVVALHHARRLGWPQERFRIIPNGIRDPVTPRRVRPRAPKPLVLGCVERLVPQKRHDLLLDAFVRLLRRRPHVRLRLVGDGPLESALRAQVHRLHLEDAVVMTGSRTDPGPEMEDMDLYVTASEREGFGLATCEAAIRGIPVVLPDLPVFRETLGPAGVFFAPGDTAALEQTLLTLVDDPDLRASVADRSARHVRERYSWKDMVEAYRELYREVL